MFKINSTFDGTRKICNTLQESKLKCVHNLGVEITKIHRVIQFELKSWLKPDIDKNTALRQGATHAIEMVFSN